MNHQDNTIYKGPAVKFKIERSPTRTIILLILLAAIAGSFIYLLQTSSIMIDLWAGLFDERFHNSFIIFITNTFVALILTLWIAYIFSDTINKPCFQEKAARNIERFIHQDGEEEKSSDGTPKGLDIPDSPEIP